MIPVEEVGTGVGYFCLSLRYFAGEYLLGDLFVGDVLRATRFTGRGSGGDDEYGSKAGNNAGTGAGRLTPTIEGTCVVVLLGEEKVIVLVIRLEQRREQDTFLDVGAARVYYRDSRC